MGNFINSAVDLFARAILGAISTVARTVLAQTTLGGMVDTLGGATSTGTGGLVRATSPSLVTPSATKATAGDVATWGAGSSKTGYLYSDATYLGIMDVAGAGSGQGFLISGSSIFCQIAGNTKATISSTGLAVTGTIKTSGYTVATLPAGTTGDTAHVTDATAPTYLGALTGGGAVVCRVFKNPTAWVSA